MFGWQPGRSPGINKNKSEDYRGPSSRPTFRLISAAVIRSPIQLPFFTPRGSRDKWTDATLSSDLDAGYFLRGMHRQNSGEINYFVILEKFTATATATFEIMIVFIIVVVIVFIIVIIKIRL